MTAGVYRVDQALSAAEADAQDGSQTPAAGGSCGVVSCLYAPPEAARVLACLPAGDLMGVLYLDAENSMLLDFVSQDGRCVEQYPLVAQVDPSTAYAERLPCQREGQAAFLPTAWRGKKHNCGNIWSSCRWRTAG